MSLSERLDTVGHTGISEQGRRRSTCILVGARTARLVVLSWTGNFRVERIDDLLDRLLLNLSDEIEVLLVLLYDLVLASA